MYRFASPNEAIARWNLDFDYAIFEATSGFAVYSFESHSLREQRLNRDLDRFRLVCHVHRHEQPIILQLASESVDPLIGIQPHIASAPQRWVSVSQTD